MESIDNYLSTSIVLSIANDIRRATAMNMSDEDFAKSPVTIDECIPKAVELFMARHAEIQRLISQHRRKQPTP